MIIISIKNAITNTYFAKNSEIKTRDILAKKFVFIIGKYSKL